MAKTLNMRFNLDSGKTTLMSIAAPKANISREDVEPVMTSIIEKEAILVGSAKATSIRSAIVREVNETKLI